MRANTVSNTRLFLALLLLLSPLVAVAENDTPTVISGITSNHGGAIFYVGNTGTNNSLTIRSGGVLTNVMMSFIGNQSTASDNRALVTDPGSAWYQNGSLMVGYNGSRNSLTITNGGRVQSTYGSIGDGAGSHSNAVLVTGSSSVWSNQVDVHVGGGGSFNQLIIADGAQVYAHNAGGIASSLGYFSTSSNNTALVTGSNSAWRIGGNLFVGNQGSHNHLVITNGGRVENSEGYIGNMSISNTVLVTGPGSVWNNRSYLYLGGSGGGNQLTIANGGRVENLSCFMGFWSGSENNQALVTGSGSVWNNTYDLNVGYRGAGNSLTVSNGGQVANDSGVLGAAGGSDNNIVLITGSGSLWTNRYDLYIGSSGSGNSLTIMNSGQVFNAIGYIGNNDSSSNNTVTVTGAGSLWQNNSDLYVGHFGAGNTLTISNGGRVASATGVLGVNSGSDNNTALVTGSGSLWSNRNDLLVGDLGAGNQLTVADGGKVVNGEGRIGYHPESSNNTVTVTGAGSQWINNDVMSVGYKGSGNSLTISNGGVVQASTATMGGDNTSHNNTALVTGNGSAWSIANELYVGVNGTNNTLTISNGGTVNSLRGYVGYAAGANGNQVNVFGSNSAWRVQVEPFTVGVEGAGNSLVISNGGLVQCLDGRVGNDATSDNNTVIVTGTGSKWQNNSELYFGNRGANNQMFIRNGGQLTTVDDSYIGFYDGANNNLIVVEGVGSVWSNRARLYLGREGGAYNSLIISNGGAVNNTYAYIGNAVSASNNSVLVTGTGSVWSNRNDLHIGYSGSGNSLTILNGGKVYAIGETCIGNRTTSVNNAVLVTGAGSVWSNGHIYVGGQGSGNSLTIANGATVMNTETFMADYAYSSNNTAIVTGTGSTWSGSRMVVGNDGSGNTLIITNGGAVETSNDAYIANAVSSSNNTVIVTGPWSTWNVGGPLIVGRNGFNNLLSVVDGASLFAGNLTVNNGTLRIDPLSTVHVTNNYSQTANGILELGIGGTAPGSYAQLLVDGTASLTGTLRIVQFNAYQPVIGDTQTVVQAGLVSGEFTEIDNQVWPLLRAVLQYDDPQAVELLWMPLSLMPYAITPNQQATAANIDGAVADPRLNALVNFLFTLPTNQVPWALDQIAPADLSAMFNLAFAGMDAYGYQLLNRIGDIRAGSHGFSGHRLSLYDSSGPGKSRQPICQNAPMFAAACADVFSPSHDNPWGVFVDGVGEFATVSGDANASGYHISSGGLTLGVDRRINDKLAVGLALGYAGVSAALANDGHVDVDNARASVYAAWFNKGFHLEGMIGGGFNSYDTRRAVFGERATGDTDGTEFETLFSGGYDWQKGIWVFGPQAVLQYKLVNIDGFTETGSMAPLHIESQDADSLHSRLGAHLGARIKAGKILLAPDVSVSWRHEYLDNSVALASRFANGAGNVFTVNGPEIGRDSVVIGAGVLVQWSPTVGTYVNYTTELGRSGYSPHTVNGGVYIRF